MKSFGTKSILGVCGGVVLLIAPLPANASRIPSVQVRETLFDNDPHIPDTKQPNSAYAGRDAVVLESNESVHPEAVVVREAARVENWFLRLMRFLHSLRMRGVIR